MKKKLKNKLMRCEQNYYRNSLTQLLLMPNPLKYRILMPWLQQRKLNLIKWLVHLGLLMIIVKETPLTVKNKKSSV